MGSVYEHCLCFGTGIGVPHLCHCCGTEVTASGIHGLSSGCHHRHAAINEIIHRSLSTAKTPSRLEPLGLLRTDGKRPDGMTITPKVLSCNLRPTEELGKACNQACVSAHHCQKSCPSDLFHCTIQERRCCCCTTDAIPILLSVCTWPRGGGPL